MIKGSPSDIDQTQPNQGRAKLFVSKISSFFEIKENNCRNSDLLENNSNLDINNSLNQSNTIIPSIKRDTTKSFTFEQSDKINIPPNQHEAKIFASKIQNSIDSISILPDPPKNAQNIQSHDNIEYSFSNLHILFAKDDYRPIPFNVSPLTSISSPFNKHLKMDQTSEETNDESKFQISNNSVAYRQCIDIELNSNFEFSEISTFSADLVQNTIEETQNLEIFDTNEPEQISIDSSYEHFEQIGNSISQAKSNKDLSFSQLSSFENENSDSLPKENKIPTQIPEKAINITKSTKSIQTQNFETETKSFKFVKMKSINLINNEKPKSKKNETISPKNKKFVALISDPVHYSIKRDDSDYSLPVKIPSISHSSSMEFLDKNRSSQSKKSEKIVSQNLTNDFTLSPIESFVSSTIDEQNENSSEILFTDSTSSPGLKLLSKNNELKICSVSHIDFNENKKIIPSFEASNIETIISLEKENIDALKSNQEEVSTPSKKNHLNDDSSSIIDSESDASKLSPQNITPRKKRIPRFTTSEPSTMANIRYSPQIDNLKNSSSIFTESESVLNHSFQESEVSTMTSINYVPDKKQILESSPFSVEIIDQKENNSDVEEKSVDFVKKNKKQNPIFTTSDLSTMANVRYSPQKDAKNNVYISSLENESSLIPSNNETSDQNSSFYEDQQQEQEKYLFNIEESEITTIISIKYDPTVSQDEEQQNELDIKKNPKESSVSFNLNKSSGLKIRNDAPNFSTSDLSTMANVRFSPKSTYSDFSNEIESNSDDEIIKESEIVKISSRKFVPNQKQLKESQPISTEQSNTKNNSIKKQKIKTEKEIPSFSTSELSTITNSRKKLEESKISSIEINDENKDDDQMLIKIEEEEEEKDEPFNINESELTTITSINYVPYQNKQQNKKLVLSKQIIIENDNNEINKDSEIKTNSRTKEIIKTKSKKIKQIPQFSTSEPSTMTNLQSTPQKTKLEESKITFIEINDKNNNESDLINKTEPKSIEIEEEEETKDEINFNESELTTITSINYVPYQNNQQNILFLSEQITIENADKEIEDEKRTDQSNDSYSQTKTNTNHIQKPKSKEIPIFSTSEPSSSSISNFQQIPQRRKLKQSQVSFAEFNNENNNDSDSNSEIKQKSLPQQEQVEEEEKEEKANIVKSELTTITSINRIPYQNQQQKNILFLSGQIIVENANNETEEETKTNSNNAIYPEIRRKKLKSNSKEIPAFSTSEPSTMTNLRSTDSKVKLEESKISFIESNYKNNKESDFNDNKTKQNDELIEIEEEEEEKDDQFNINESELTTITSINYIPFQNEQQEETSLVLSEEIVIDNGNNDTDKENEETKPKPKRVKKPNQTKAIKNKQTKPNRVPLFTTSEPSSLANLQSSPHQDKAETNPDLSSKNLDKQNITNSADEINDDFDSDSQINLNKDQEQQNENEIDQDDFNNIEESDLMTIVSIKYDPELSQEENQQNTERNINFESENDNTNSDQHQNLQDEDDFKTNHSTNDDDENESATRFSTPKRKDKKQKPQFTTSDPQVNSLSNSAHKSDSKPLKKQVKSRKKPNKEKNETKHSNKTKFSFETSEMVVISDDSYISPNKDLNRSEFFTTEIQNNSNHDKIDTQNISHKNSKLVLNEPLTINKSDLNQEQSSSIKNDKIPHFEFSELTTNANIKENLHETSKAEQKQIILSNTSTLTDDKSIENKQDETNNYLMERKELSQFVSFEHSSIQNQLEPSKAVVSESPQAVKKKTTKAKKNTDLIIENKLDSDDLIDKQKTNKYSLTINKNDTFFVNNSKPENINEENSNKTSHQKKKPKQKDVKSSSNMQNLKEQHSLNRTEISVQTSIENNNNDNSNNFDSYKLKSTELLPSGAFTIETNDKEKRGETSKKKKHSISSQTDDQNQSKEESETTPKEGDKSNPPLTVSDSLTNDSNSNQNLPKFEQSLITTISNISMNPNEQKQATFHLSFQQNPALMIKEDEKKNPLILFNSQSETFQLIKNESNQFSVANNQLSILPDLKPDLSKPTKKSINKMLSNDQTQTEPNNFSISTNNEAVNFEKSIEIPRFESSDPTTILSLDKKEEEEVQQQHHLINHAKYNQASTQISDDSIKENVLNLETSPSVVAQNFSDENNVLSSSGIKTVADYQSTIKKNDLEISLNEIVFANEKESTESKKTELVMQHQCEISKIDNDHFEFETNQPSTIVSIPFKVHDSDLKIEENKTLFEVENIENHEINQDEKETKKDSKQANLSMSKNYDVFENMTKPKTKESIHFNLSEITNITDISEFDSVIQSKSQNDSILLNLDQNLNKFTISSSSKEFHESLPVSIFSSNKEIDETNKKQVAQNEYENQILFEQKPERKQKENKNKNKKQIDFEQSDLINILSIHKEQDDYELNPSQLSEKEAKNEQPTRNENQLSEQIIKNIEITDFYQKVDESNSEDKIVCRESDPITLVSIQNKNKEKPKQPNYEFTSNGTIFAQEQTQANSIDSTKKTEKNAVLVRPTSIDKKDIEISNFICFEKRIQTSMSKVFGSLYLKPESPKKPRAKLSLNQDQQFYFEENSNSANNNSEIKSPMKTSRSLENLDSFTIKKEKNPLTMIFGSFSVQNDKEKDHDKQSIETQTGTQSNQAKEKSSLDQKKQNFNTVFGCFEIQSPSTEKDEKSTTKSKEKKSFEIIKGTNCSLSLSPQKANASTSTENCEKIDTTLDGFDKKLPSEKHVEISDKKDSFSNTEKNSLSITNTFGRFDISPGTYDRKGSKEEIQQKSAIVDDSTSQKKVSLPLENSRSFFIESDQIKTQPLSKENDYFYVNNQVKEEETKSDKIDKNMKPILMLENKLVSIQVENDSTQPSCEFYSSEIADINKENKANLEKLSLNTINIEPTKDSSTKEENKANLEKLSLNTINIEPTHENKANLEKISLNTINIEPTTNDKKQQQLSIGKNSPSINLPEESASDKTNDFTKNQEIELHECQNMLFEVPHFNQEEKNFDLLLNQSEFQIQPNPEISTKSVRSNPIQREFVENNSFEIPLTNNNDNNDDTQIVVKNQHQYDDDKNNVEIKTSFPLFYELRNQNFNDDDFDDADIEQKMQSCSITNSNSFFVEPEIKLSTNQAIEEEENEKSQIGDTDFSSPIFSNIDLCKKLISRQMREIKSLEKEVVKKDVALDSLNKKFELFKESTKNMLAKHFGEIRSLNETNAKLVSQIDSLQTRLASKNDAVFSHLKQQQKNPNFSIFDANEIFSIEPKQIEKNKTFNNVLITVTVEDLEPSILQMENFLQSSNLSNVFIRNSSVVYRRLFISNPSSYEETGLLNNLPLLRESGKITQFSLLPKSSFIPLKVDTNLNFEKKEIKPSLSFSFYHLRVTRPKFFSNLHLEDNLTVAHILPQKTNKINESSNNNSSSKSEIRRNIERSQIFLPGDDNRQKQNKMNHLNGFQNSGKKLSLFVPNSLYVKPKEKPVLSSYEECFDIKRFSPKLVIKKTQAISLIAQKRQK